MATLAAAVLTASLELSGVLHMEQKRPAPENNRHLDDDQEKHHRPQSREQVRRELGFDLIRAEREEAERRNQGKS